MPNTRVNEPYVEMHQREMLRKAEQHRLIRKAQPPRYTLFRTIFRGARIWFGRGMVAAGRGLQERGRLLHKSVLPE